MNDSIGALWEKEGNGGKYFSGVVEIDGKKTNIVVFRNKYKEQEKHPDYRILISKPKEERLGTGKHFGNDDDITF